MDQWIRKQVEISHVPQRNQAAVYMLTWHLSVQLYNPSSKTLGSKCISELGFLKIF